MGPSSRLERRAKELAEKLKSEKLGKKDFYEAGERGDLAYIAVFEREFAGNVWGSEGLKNAFYAGIGARVSLQNNDFDKAFEYFTSHPFFIPVGDTQARLDEVLALKGINEVFQFTEKKSVKERWKKRGLDYSKASALLHLGNAGYFIINQLKKPLRDVKDYQETVDEFRRLFDLACFAAPRTQAAEQTRYLAQVVHGNAEIFVKKLAAKYHYPIPDRVSFG